MERLCHLDGILYEAVLSPKQRESWRLAQEKRDKLNRHVQWALTPPKEK